MAFILERIYYYNFLKNKAKLWLLPPIVLGIIGGIYYWLSAQTVYTENAYIKTDMVAVSAEITGKVITVNVIENQIVKKGDLLFCLDPEPFQITVDRLTAQLQSTYNNIEIQKAVLLQKQTAITLGEKDQDYYQKEFDRAAGLFEKRTISAAQRDLARHNLDQAQQKLQTAIYDLKSTLAYLNGDPDVKAENHPAYAAIKADLDKAQLDLRRTKIFASEDGIITRNTLVEGDQVNTGAPIFSIFVTNNLWIEANFKETELTHIQAGQKARIWVDTYPDCVWTGYVEGVGAAAGSELSILPPQNATGNWVKIVQRIPVRLKINEADLEKHKKVLRAGMSVSVEINTSPEIKKST
jgi:membrane fusion protein (multidrug efflux system)